MLPGVGSEEQESLEQKSLFGYVESVQEGAYRVILQTSDGRRGYRFPKSVCPQELASQDSVQCYVVRNGDKLEPRLERLPEPQPDPEARAAFERIIAKEIAGLEEKYG